MEGTFWRDGGLNQYVIAYPGLTGGKQIVDGKHSATRSRGGHTSAVSKEDNYEGDRSQS